ncbi:MAG: hypothetical protein JWR29_1803 [Tardiphaga sp.]|jgi:hypothetical protein|nr:hypothetical protein [Tardiphaga sp.]
MRHHQRHYRTYLQFGLAIALVAVPLLAYANIAPDAGKAAPVVNVAPPPVASAINPAAVTTPCDSQNWPNYSPDCVRGQSNPVEARQIALVTNDVPLTSLPRVIAAPLTSQHLVTGDVQKKVARSVERPRVAQRPTPRFRVAVRAEAPAAPMMAAEDRLPAGW